MKLGRRQPLGMTSSEKDKKKYWEILHGALSLEAGLSAYTMWTIIQPLEHKFSYFILV